MGSLRLLPLFVLLSLCVPQTRLEAQFVISEFVASNVEGIIDEDGNHEDWIEIYNSGLSAASLRDWYLTDKSSQLRKWAFPDKILQPGQYLVVFASNKDRRNPAANLHTNFGLDAGGEYLALTKGETNGGTTVVQSWNEYLPQAADVSFGLVQTGGSANLISAGSAVKWLVPNSTTGPAIGTTWRGGNEPFTETGWSTGVAALGLAGPPPVVGAESLQHRYNSTTNALGYDSSGAGRNATSSGAAFLLSDTDSSVAPLKRAGVMQFIGAENDQVSIPANSAYNAASATVCFWLRANLPAGAGNAGAMLWDRRPDYATAGLVIIQQDDGKIGLQSNNAYSSLSGAVNVSDNTWHHVAVTINQGAGEPVAVYVDGELDSSINNTAAWSWTTAQAIELGRSHDAFWRRYTGLLDDVRFYSRLLTPSEIQQIAQGADSLMGTSLFSTTGVDAADISTQLAGMASVNSSAYVRIPFTASAPATLGGVRLTVRFCDGFKAWINGTEVASFNAPAIPLWDSIATGAHDPGRSRLQTVTIPASGLKAGANVLALQVLNNSASDPNVLLRPVLDALPLGSGTSSYLVTPTPGSANSAGLAALGPHISRTTSNPARPVGGAGSAPLLITTRVQARLGPVASVQLAYRVMWGAEALITMQQGANGDFSAQIPTSGLKAGDMLRWRIIAKDTANTQSTDPLFLNLDGVAGADTDQYFGTVAQEGGYNTQLPVLYWFVQNPNGISPGTQCSIFYRDRFYDYVGVSIHGQSTQSFPKKSLNLSFNKGNRFAWAPGEAEIRSVNLLSDYADKSKVRNTMAYETWHSMQHPASHFSNLLHVRQATGTAPAAAFYGLYDMVEDGNEEFLARCGLDANGALYKMYNSLESTSGAEKKTREFENVSDLQALIDGVNPGTKSIAQRRQYAYDNVDIPALINFAAVNTMILNTDWGHKNYYVYRDTLGTKEWMPIPWDQDLSFGHCYTGAQGYFDDDIRSQGGLVVGGTGNYLVSLVYAAPELNQMFVRRIRTLMDQYLGSAAATTGPFETRISQLVDQLDPPGATYLTDADRELQKWGYWTDGSGSQLFSGTLDAAVHDHGVRKQALRILSANPTPPNPSSTANPELGNTTASFLRGRRTFLYTANPNSNGLGVPPLQPSIPVLTIEQIDFNPASGNQDEEYFVIKNSSGTSVDLSGWQITGAVNFTFHGGTIIPAYTNGTDNIGLLYVAKSPAAFRVRTQGATGGQYRLVVGPYSGSLSARGETLALRNPGGVLLKSQTWAPASTAAQNQLRVSELNYSPAPPTTGEMAAIPGVSAADFEFLELTNIGATALNLSGVKFVKGIEFAFPLGTTLAAGARLILVSNRAAFLARYGAGVSIGGQYLGNLNDGGDTLQLLDSQGEEILEFHYEPSWFPESNGLGRTLVTRSAAPNWSDYGSASAPLPAVWALSAAPGGTPAMPDTDFSSGYNGWRFDYWTLEELSTSGALVNPADDADGDGMSNFAEYCFGQNPRVKDAALPPRATVVTVEGIDYPGILFIRRHLALDIVWNVEESDNLIDWKITGVFDSNNTFSNGVEQAIYRSKTASNQAPRFLRASATK